MTICNAGVTRRGFSSQSSLQSDAPRPALGCYGKDHFRSGFLKHDKTLLYAVSQLMCVVDRQTDINKALQMDGLSLVLEKVPSEGS